MASILKIVSIPVKWASKKIINKAVLSFPGGEEQPTIACVYCPEMCRFSCPTAVVSGDDTVTPCNKMGLLYKETKWPGQASQGGELWPLYDCTGCGRCAEYCKYEMPVMERLFSARAQYSWEPARTLAQEMTEDLYGDLAAELGDLDLAKKRTASFLERSEKGKTAVWEPKASFYLSQNGHSASAGWDDLLKSIPDPAQLNLLRGKKWLVHESVWLSRHMDKAKLVLSWVEGLKKAGIQIILPFEAGRDCKDCGGEGAFRKLFSDQALAMARDIWVRDADSVDGILCFSDRCVEHLKTSLKNGSKSPDPIISVRELYPSFFNKVHKNG